MSRFRAVPYNDETELNLSSMLDVVFIMLIFFVVTATFLEETAMPVTLPDKSVVVPPDDFDTITVVVEPASTFRINGRVMPAASVRPYVRALYAENPEATFAVLLTEGSIVKDAAVAIEAGRSVGLDIIPLARQ